MTSKAPSVETIRLYMPYEVAEAFRVDVKTVTRWAKAGKLPYIRTLGGHRRYPADAVDDLLANGCARGPRGDR